MKARLIGSLWLFVCLTASAVPTTVLLESVMEPGFNEIELAFDPPFFSEKTATTALTSNVEVRLEVDPATGAVSEMTILNGSVVGDPITLQDSSFLVGSYELNSTALGATLETPDPPGLVNPATGDFEASQHTFAVNSGSLSGDVSIPLGGIDEEVDFDFADMPIAGAAMGQGNISLVPTGATATQQCYQVTVLLPIEISEEFELEGPTGSLPIPISASGTAKLVGEAKVDLVTPDPFSEWAASNGLAGVDFAEDFNGDGVPNGLQWALGLDAFAPPFSFLLRPAENDAVATVFTFELPVSGSAAELTILYSSDLGSAPFVPLGAGAVSVGNPVPAGTAGVVEIALPPGQSGFVRLSADPPPG